MQARVLFRFLQSNQYTVNRFLAVSATNQFPRGSNAKVASNFVQSSENVIDDKDFETLQQIENNLFENKTHKPTQVAQLFKKIQHKSQEKQSKRKPNTEQIQPRKNPFQNDTTTLSSSPLLKKEQLKSTTSTTTDLVNDTSLGIKYRKLRINDPLLAKILLEARGRKRIKTNDNLLLPHQFITEGWKLTLEAINAGFELQTLLFSKKENIQPILNKTRLKDNVEIFKVPQESIRTWSVLTTCPGLIGVFKSIRNKQIEKPKCTLPITVICDNIREPSNLGSIIRTCAALPCQDVIVLKGCCDPWETKALRGGCGGQFQINIHDDLMWDNIDELLPKDSQIFIAENNSHKRNDVVFSDYTEIKISPEKHIAVIIGGETHGISDDAYKFFSSRHNYGSCINIPLAKGIESLNTSSALTVILFEMRRRLQLLKASEEDALHDKMQQDTINV